MSQRLILLLLMALAPLSLLLALSTGSIELDMATVWATLLGRSEGLPAALILELRLPRALSAFATGGLLALAGTLMQVLLRNPLAEPYILGTSGGAAVAALLSMLFGLSSFAVDAAAFGGAMGLSEHVTMRLVLASAAILGGVAIVLTKRA